MRKIGLLIVTGLLFISLGIAAIPNFIDAQIRQRTARAHVNLTALAAALEAYRADYDKYPGDGAQYCWGYPNYPYNGTWYVPDTLTTPIAYISSSIRIDPFRENSAPYSVLRYVYIDMDWGMAGTRTSPSIYYPFLKSWYGSWKLNSAGPDGNYGPYYPLGSHPGNQYPQLQVQYDPTNGVSSYGDIIISQIKSPELPPQ